MNIVCRHAASWVLVSLFSCWAVEVLAQSSQAHPQAAPPAVAAPGAPRGSADSGPAAQTPSSAAGNTPQPAVNPRNPFQLSADQLRQLDHLLSHWESRSGDVKTFSCDFVRYEYDHVFGPKDPRIAKTKSEGLIRYASPDKGEFRVIKSSEYTVPKDGQAAGQFKPRPQEANEHWICDGKSIFELDAEKKQLIQQQLPPELQGKKIAEGPLPFLFGAEKEKLISRYWIRQVRPPQDRENEYWFEAYPKTREDAANYRKLTVILDSKHFLPTALQVFPPNYDPRTNPSRTVYTFSNRKTDDLIHRSRKFFDRFISPRTPLGWKKVVMNFGGQPPAAQTARQPTDQAQRPAPTAQPR